MTFKRLAPGLYEAAETDSIRIEQDTEGFWGATSDWWIHLEYPSALLGPYRTLKDAKEAAEGLR